MDDKKYLWVAPLPTSVKGWAWVMAALALTMAALQWSAQGAQLSAAELAAGIPQIADFLSRTFPPTGAS